jgi:hypothetical protein
VLSSLSLHSLLSDSIRRHAGSRVREVTVNCGTDRVVVQGKADSYYGWQLAIVACRQSLVGRCNLPLDCRFEVDRDGLTPCQERTAC